MPVFCFNRTRESTEYAVRTHINVRVKQKIVNLVSSENVKICTNDTSDFVPKLMEKKVIKP